MISESKTGLRSIGTKWDNNSCEAEGPGFMYPQRNVTTVDSQRVNGVQAGAGSRVVGNFAHHELLHHLLDSGSGGLGSILAAGAGGHGCRRVVAVVVGRTRRTTFGSWPWVVRENSCFMMPSRE